MEDNVEFVGLIIGFFLIVVVLYIILFFKIWAMTDSVSEIKELLKEWLEIEHPVIEDDDKNINKK